MSTNAKIKIIDNIDLRNEIENLHENIDQVCLAKWSIALAKHTLNIVELDYKIIDGIVEGFRVNELWQVGKARVYDVRQAGFKIHKIARECDSEINKTVLRVVGHAIASGHMKEHAMVASDYAIKTIGLISGNNIKRITLEREWQLQEIKKFL